MHQGQIYSAAIQVFEAVKARRTFIRYQHLDSLAVAAKHLRHNMYPGLR